MPDPTMAAIRDAFHDLIRKAGINDAGGIHNTDIKIRMNGQDIWVQGDKLIGALRRAFGGRPPNA